MPLPTRDQLLSLDYSGSGEPFVLVHAKSGINTLSLDVSSDGGPWVGLANATTSVLKISSTLLSVSGKVASVSVASISKISNTANS